MRLTVRRRVVLPEPLRPRMAVVVPSSMVSDISSSSRRPWGVEKARLRNSMAEGMRIVRSVSSLMIVGCGSD